LLEIELYPFFNEVIMFSFDLSKIGL